MRPFPFEANVFKFHSEKALLRTWTTRNKSIQILSCARSGGHVEMIDATENRLFANSVEKKDVKIKTHYLNAKCYRGEGKMHVILPKIVA